MAKQSRYRDSEIKKRLPDGTIILKEGVAKRYRPYSPEEVGTINHNVIFMKRWNELMMKLYGIGGDEPEEHE